MLKETNDELGLVSPELTHIQPRNPKMEKDYLRGLFVAKAKRDAERRAKGQPPTKAGWVGVLFKEKFGRWPSPHAIAVAQEEAKSGKRK